MERPKLSIITINFNDSIGLNKTMNSVFDQTFKDFEYIIIDGGSEDGSVELIEQNQDRITHWVSEKDRGIYHAMNKGIETSQGNYLLFLNSGDTLASPTALVDFIDHPSFTGDVIYGDYKFENGNKIYPDNLYPSYFMKTSLPHQSTIFNKKVFELMGKYDEKYKIGADRAFFIKCYLSGKFIFQHINYFLTIFDLSGVSNDPEFLKRKKEEDELLLSEEYGSKYQEYRDALDFELQQNAIRRNSFRGIVKRIKRRLQELWIRS